MSRPPSPESTRRSIRSSASTARPSIQSSRGAPSLASTHDSRHTTQSSHHSHQSKRSSPPLINDGLAQRIWSNTPHAPGGHRTESKIRRGVVSRSPGGNEAAWRIIVQTVISYDFQDPDLLEEALESQDSGVTCVGKSHRHFHDGNRGLATVGEAVMKLVLKDQCYLFKIPEGDAENMIDLILSRTNLDRLGRSSQIEQFIRPRKGVRPTQRKNILALLTEDARSVGADPSRLIARGIKAIIGAVYYDGGFDSARRVMAQLDLIIKLPEEKPAPELQITYQ